ncbi:hypothetical protein [Streptomyces sp. GS7]|uniref:hypothetical protein n=1 Tax=Streptomyces sp. GS7 TaxID=2692234 RepID=UPI00131645BF|nr:hypothetical protein [Streptomyces sp. GS7]QHC23137.1 hypothetical protein GR130_18695 [Streptomyces sp. GS7]
MAIGLLVAGCGSDGSDGKKGAGEGGGKAAAGASLPTTAKLAADSGARYRQVNVPSLDGMTCDKGDGGFQFGSDRAMIVPSVDGLTVTRGDTGDDKVSCFAPQRIVLSKGAMRVTAPNLTTRTSLYAKVADPAAALDKVFDRAMGLAKGYGRVPVGKPESFTTAGLVLKCQQNVSDTIPMTTCLWANYGAIGVVDLFPPAGRHLPLDEAAAQTYKFARGVLAVSGATS